MNERELEALNEAAARELARRHLGDFIALLDPRYQRPPHTRAFCDLAERLERREVRRAMVFCPPRCGKSLHFSQALPAWHLGRSPRAQVILASYAAERAEGNSRRARQFVQDERSPFTGRVSVASSSVGRWHTTAGGGVIAAGVGGGLTGFGADLLVIDDPVKDREEADSDVLRERNWNWLSEVALTRLMPQAAVLIAMTRWHEDDIGGRLLNSRGADQWEVLNLPALAEEDDPLGRPEGAPLWPEWFPREDLPSVERGEISSRAFAALYQQRPTPETGGMIKRAWLDGRYEILPEYVHVVQAVDAAFKTGVANDYSVIATWACDRRNFYLVDVWRRRVEYPDLIRAIKDKFLEFDPGAILIEDAGPGQSAIQDLRRSSRLPVVKRTPKGSKESRLAVVSCLFEAGKIVLPPSAPWLDEWIEEHVAFPRGRHDDQVDTTVLAVEELRPDTGPRVRGLIAR